MGGTSPLVYLDVGHVEDTWENTGGKGVVKDGREYEEYHHNLEIIERAAELLKANGVDARITENSYGETNDLNARTDEANAAGAELLVSGHANAGSANAEGACIFHWGTTEDFANLWVDEWTNANMGVGLHGNGKHEVKVGTWTNLHMVREAVMPSYIIEHGFMTNDHDFEYIFGDHSKEHRKKAAKVIAKTVCRYFDIKFEEKQNVEHTIEKGDTLWDLAQEYDTSVGEIKGQNPNVDLEPLNIGQVIELPTGVSKAEEKKKSPSIYAPEPLLQDGDKGSRVKMLQKALNAVYFKVGAEDGIFGPKTKDGVKRFQSVYDPSYIDSIYGERTEKRLQNQLDKR